jgi:hypothetical protein
MTYAEPYERFALIKGFRTLADYLEANPDVPAPSYADVHVFPPNGECAVIRAEIDGIAELLSREAYETASRQHYIVTRSFGPVEYRAVAICKQHDHGSDQDQEVGQ